MTRGYVGSAIDRAKKWTIQMKLQLNSKSFSENQLGVLPVLWRRKWLTDSEVWANTVELRGARNGNHDQKPEGREQLERK